MKAAVIGATTNKEKFGNRVVVSLKEQGHEVFPVNPKYDEVEGLRCFPDLDSCPKPDIVVTVVPSEITEMVVKKAKELNISRVWMQPGSESDKAIEFCKNNGIKVNYHECVMVKGLNL